MPRLLENIRKWIDEQHLHSMSDRELMDFGVSRGDFMTALGAPRDTRARMEAMAAAHGLPANVIDEEHWRALDIARACAQCGSRPQCKRWLGGQDTAVAPDRFCPNAPVYAELAAQHGLEGPVQKTSEAGKKDDICGYI